MSDISTVAVLGAGALGAAMAARLGDTHHAVRLWNRTPERARAAARDATGITAVDSVRDAVRDADVVITVLRDGDAVSDVMNDAIAAVGAESVWVQASTIGPQSASALAELARAHGVAYLDAPVSGSTAPARRGALVWLVAGDDTALTRARPVLDDLGSSVMHVGHGVEGSAVKLAVNSWMTAATVAMSDVLSLADGLAIEHATLLQAIGAGPLLMPYAAQKASLMYDRDYAPGFAVELALKDLKLAASSVAPSPLLEAVQDRLELTVKAGHGDDDLAAVDFARTEPPEDQADVRIRE
jgi:3-hydroxyisobutyrate dehydrogenase